MYGKQTIFTGIIIIKNSFKRILQFRKYTFPKNKNGLLSEKELKISSKI